MRKGETRYVGSRLLDAVVNIKCQTNDNIYLIFSSRVATKLQAMYSATWD